MKRYSIHAGEVRLSVLESIGSSSVPILLFHGNSGSARAFESILAGRLGMRHRIMAVDLPGHGFSERVTSEDGYSPAALQLAIRLAISVLTVGAPYIVCGHSLGGHLLTQSLPGLSRVLGLLLVAAPPMSPRARSMVFRADPTDGGLFGGKLGVSQRDTFARCIADPARIGAEAFERVLGDIKACDPHFRPALGRAIAAGAFDRENEIAANIDVPIGLCLGRHDAFIASEQVHQIALKRPWLETAVLFRNSGHSPHLEEPEAFTTTLDRFVADVTT